MAALLLIACGEKKTERGDGTLSETLSCASTGWTPPVIVNELPSTAPEPPVRTNKDCFFPVVIIHNNLPFKKIFSL